MPENSNPASSPVPYPVLVIVQPGSWECDPTKQTVFSLPDRQLHYIATPEPTNRKTSYFPTPQGWVLVVVPADPSSSWWWSGSTTYLLNPEDRSRIELPPLGDNDELPATKCRCVLSDRVPVPGSVVLVFDLQSPAMWHCRVGGRWFRHDYDIGSYELSEEYCPPPCPRTRKKNLLDVAAVDGRFFFVESDDVLGTVDFFEHDDQRPRLGVIAVPGVDFAEGFTATYLVDSGGRELLMVRIGFQGLSVDGPWDLRVYRMDFASAVWRRTEDVGDRALLLGDENFAASCSASGCGLRANCVYWMNCFGEGGSILYAMDLHGSGAEELMRRGNSPGVPPRPFWVLPIGS
uniref:Uncharacterized protein n=1 Tax=Avena sativa TaxID=4498 RepID=A0ACD5Y2G5_AVESA